MEYATMIFRQIGSISLLTICLLFAGNVFGNDTPTINSILENFERMESNLFSQGKEFYIQYASVVAEKLFLEPGKKNPYIPVTYTCAQKDGIWGMRAVLTGEDPQKPEKTQEVTNYCTKGNIIDWMIDSNHAVVSLFEFGRNSYRNWYYFQNFGVVPFRSIAESNGAVYEDVLKESEKDPSLEPLQNLLLPDCIKHNTSKYVVQSNQEEVDGHLCWVVEWPKMDKIWIDPQIGGAIRKRIVSWPKSGHVKSEITNRDYKELKEGIYLPFRQDVLNYVGPELGLSQEHWGKEFSHFVYEVHSMQIDSIDETAEQFLNVTLPVNTSVFDVRTNTEYTIFSPDGHDPFAGPIEQGIKVNRFVMHRSISIIIGSILILIAIWLLLRNTEKK